MAPFFRPVPWGNAATSRAHDTSWLPRRRRGGGSLAPEQMDTLSGGPGHPSDPWSYSLEEDGRTVEAFLDYAREQGLTPKRYSTAELFVAPGMSGA